MKIVPTKTQPAQTAHGQSNRSLSNVLKQAYHVAYLLQFILNCRRLCNFLRITKSLHMIIKYKHLQLVKIL